MTGTGHPVLHLLLGATGIAAALAASHLAHGLLWQTLLGATAYLATTALAGRLSGVGPGAGIADSITALAATAAWALDLAGLVATGLAALLTNDDEHPDQPLAAVPDDPDHYAKTA